MWEILNWFMAVGMIITVITACMGKGPGDLKRYLETNTVFYDPDNVPDSQQWTVIDTMMPIGMGAAGCRLWRNAGAWDPLRPPNNLSIPGRYAMHAFLKCALFLAALFLFIGCSNPATPAPTPAPPAPTETTTAAPTSISVPTATISPETPQAATPDEEKLLTILYWQAPTLPGPYLSPGNKDEDAGAITLEPLARYDPDGNLIPSLAADIPTIENGGVNENLTSITWQLEEGLKWSDGSDMTAHDVVFTWRYCTDEATGCAASAAFTGISTVRAIDDTTVWIGFDEPAPYPYTAFVSSGTPIISRAQFADCVGEAADTESCQEQNTAPLGTGPYRITSFRTNEEVFYERNPFYRGPEPYFDRVVMKGGGGAISAAAAVLQDGAADYAWNLQVDPGVLARMEAAGKGKVVSAFAGLVERITVNQTNPDPELGEDRSEFLGGQNPHPFLTFTAIPQAMSLAIDRSHIAELYGFAGKPTCNFIAGPPHYASTANDGCLAQDIRSANILLDENLVIDSDGDGIREHNGIPLRITYQTSTNSIRQETQELVRDWWRQIGIETELTHHDASLFFGSEHEVNAEASLRRFFADVQMYTDLTGIDPQESLSGQLCGQIPARDNHWAGTNTSRACNPEYDALFAELSQTRTGQERERLVKQLNDILVRNYYEIPLVNRGLVSAHLNTLKGVGINGWDSEMWNIAEWRR